MKNQSYKEFKNIVISAKSDDAIWWCGTVWMDLTDKQLQDIKDVLYLKKFDGVITIEKDKRGEWYMMPSGLKIKRNSIKEG